MRKTAWLFALVFFVAVLVLADEDVFSINRLSDKTIVLTEKSPMENIIVAIASKQGIVVVDSTSSPYTAGILRKTIEKEFGRDDFAYLVITHHHFDHAWGNQVFDDAEIVGYEGCAGAMPPNAEAVQSAAAQMKQRAEQLSAELESLDPNSERAQNLRLTIDFNTRNYKGLSQGFVPTPPETTFDDRMIIELGDITLKLYYFGRAHSGTDILIHVPEEGLLMTGDLFLERGWLPLFSGRPTLDVPRWIEVLHSVLGNESQVKYVIPGHRDVWKREKLVLWKDYIVDLWNGVNVAAAEGLGLDAALERFPLPEKFAYLKGYGWDDAALNRFQRRNVTAFWRQLKESAATIISAEISASGIESAIKKYYELKSRPGNDVYFSEEDFNALGYRLLQTGRVDDAIEVFKLNVEAYPESWNVYDSLGEAYMAAGQNEPAIKNYKKSLELNPGNGNARQMLERLEEEK